MRPVNLIPPEQRRGASSPMRTGPIVYIVIGVLVAALAGVVALTLANNEISERKSEIAELRHEGAALQARAQRLSPYTAFRTMHEQRVLTVSTLADSRFDWERVMRELSLVLPSDVWLSSLTATASPQASVGSGSGEGTSGSGLRGSIAGPALEINGCANGQEGVAGFVTTLKDIDGVTRVGVQSSALPAVGEGAGTSSGGESSGSSDCRTRGFIAQFQIVIAFDAAPVPASATAEEAVAEVPAESTSETSSSSTEGSEAAPESSTPAEG
jgi:Tfp pilus assembly protein PilN